METDDVAVFVHAAASGGLSAAARRLGLTPAAASRRLMSLEARLKVRLMHRTTRSASLTAEGETFLPYARALVDAADEGRAALLPVASGASGLLRLTAPANFGRRLVAPLVPALLARHPQLRIDLVLTDAVLDLAGGGFDLAVRVARLRDSGLVGQRLATNPIALCAAPAYLARAGVPSLLADLAGHEALALGGEVVWPFEAGGRERQVRVASRFAANSIDAVREACLGGAGLALLSEFDVRDEIARGELVALTLADARPADLDVWAVYPTARQLPRKVRVFVEALRARLASGL